MDAEPESRVGSNTTLRQPSPPPPESPRASTATALSSGQRVWVRRDLYPLRALFLRQVRRESEPPDPTAARSLEGTYDCAVQSAVPTLGNLSTPTLVPATRAGFRLAVAPFGLSRPPVVNPRSTPDATSIVDDNPKPRHPDGWDGWDDPAYHPTLDELDEPVKIDATPEELAEALMAYRPDDND